MLREAQIPFLLWLPTAIIMHILGGGGAIRAAQYSEDQARLLAFTRNVRGEVSQALLPGETTVEIFAAPMPDAAEEQTEAVAKAADKEEPPAPTEPSIATPLAPKPEVAKQKTKKDEAPATSKPPESKADKRVVVLPPKDNRLAIQNDPELDKDQDDNPDAPRIADHAHRTDDETMARIRSYDQNAPKPTAAAGKTHDPTVEQTGDDHHDAPGFSVEREGDEAPRAGSEKGPEEANPEGADRSLDRPANAGRKGKKAETAVASRKKGEGHRKPAVTGSADGPWRIDPEAGDGQAKQAARKGRRGRKRAPAVPGQPRTRLPARYSVNAHGVREALGAETLRADQERARNSRLAKHRGRFKNADFQRFRAAIENYDPTVKPGNQTSLNAARVPFAGYINRMHNRIHPIFADRFLRSLDKLSPNEAIQNMKLVTHIELVIDKERGRLLKSGIVKPSGVTAFEVAALRSLEQAAPFGQPPAAIVSPDGKVYLHWEFYRNPYYACTSRFARPYILKHPPDSAPTPETPDPPASPPSADERYGQRGPIRSPDYRR